MANASSSPPGSSVAGALRCAARSVDLTPAPGSPLAGYLARGDAVAEGVLDPLEATIVRLGDPRPGGESVTWVALDSLAVDTDLAAAISKAVARASNIPPESVVVAASHTHSGPSGWVSGLPFAAPQEGDPGMRAELVQRIALAAASLAEDEVPVWPVLTVGEARDVGTNRTDPRLPSDRSVGTLRLIDERGLVRSMVVDHASHATVLGHDNLLWSADWPGAARRALAAALGDRLPFTPVVAFLQGPAGDASPRFVRRDQSPAEVERIGDLFAAQVLALVERGAPPDDEPVVAIRRQRIEIPTRDLPEPSVLARRVAEAEQEWRAASLAGSGTPGERIARTRHEGALTAAALVERGLPPSVELPISLVVLGNDAWLHLPVELFSSYAETIRAASPFRQTRVIGYADGYFGYVADEAAHRSGTYEALSSMFDPAGARALVDASIGLLTQTYDEIWPRSRHA